MFLFKPCYTVKTVLLNKKLYRIIKTVNTTNLKVSTTTLGVNTTNLTVSTFKTETSTPNLEVGAFKKRVSTPDLVVLTLFLVVPTKKTGVTTSIAKTINF